MDYWADLPVKESCSILERATKNGGTASCRSAVFFGCEEEEEGKRTGTGLRGERGGWERTLRGRKMNWRVGNGTRRGGTGLGEGRNNDFEEDENGTWRREKTGL